MGWQEEETVEEREIVLSTEERDELLSKANF
jgi:hypothetical protein